MVSESSIKKPPAVARTVTVSTVASVTIAPRLSERVGDLGRLNRDGIARGQQFDGGARDAVAEGVGDGDQHQGLRQPVGGDQAVNGGDDRMGGIGRPGQEGDRRALRQRHALGLIAHGERLQTGLGGRDLGSDDALIVRQAERERTGRGGESVDGDALIRADGQRHLDAGHRDVGGVAQRGGEQSGRGAVRHKLNRLDDRRRQVGIGGYEADVDRCRQAGVLCHIQGVEAGILRLGTAGRERDLAFGVGRPGRRRQSDVDSIVEDVDLMLRHRIVKGVVQRDGQGDNVDVIGCHPRAVGAQR